ncbi:hypothetical protein [Yersinia rohdei]|uniref:hypothetical protein n=1 Tax=Yersinia rohdei TaxID=29485 RepID=UPI0025AB0D2A|nr:hypothetical protein [Yersinia rohdei]MDN0093920.1 hypothetical protein [Yersinia rohdei]
MEEIQSLARIALAAKRSEESHSRREVWDGGNTWVQCSRQAYDRHEAAGQRVRVLYERPQLNSPEMLDGWKLVPINPTAEMMAAAMECDDVVFDLDDDTIFCVQFDNIYAAMLASAPEKP